MLLSTQVPRVPHRAWDSAYSLCVIVPHSSPCLQSPCPRGYGFFPPQFLNPSLSPHDPPLLQLVPHFSPPWTGPGVPCQVSFLLPLCHQEGLSILGCNLSSLSFLTVCRNSCCLRTQHWGSSTSSPKLIFQLAFLCKPTPTGG